MNDKGKSGGIDFAASIIFEDVGFTRRDHEGDLRGARGQHPFDEMLADGPRPLDAALQAAPDREQLLRERQRLNPRPRTGCWNQSPHR